MKTHEYQYDISTLLTKDSTGLVSSFVLQLDSILAEGGITETTQKIVDETMQFLHNLLEEDVEEYQTQY